GRPGEVQSPPSAAWGRSGRWGESFLTSAPRSTSGARPSLPTSGRRCISGGLSGGSLLSPIFLAGPDSTGWLRQISRWPWSFSWASASRLDPFGWADRLTPAPEQATGPLRTNFVRTSRRSVCQDRYPWDASANQLVALAG